ncbi:MAG: hypothetical protein JW878_01725 [Methanomicrobia archaeon]|nr:hypothetical protein [Methanomicrobia archaeon]
MGILEEFRRDVGHIIDKDVLELDFVKPKIDDDERELTKALTRRYRGSVRISTGLFYTDEERAKTIEDLSKVKLP